MEISEILISFASGGLVTLIGSFLFLRAKKKKEFADASLAEANAHKQHIENKVMEFDYYIKRLDQIEKDYDALRLAKQISDNEYDKKVRDKCTEISVLRSKVVFLSGLRCDRSDCSQRLIKHKKDVEKEY